MVLSKVKFKLSYFVIGFFLLNLFLKLFHIQSTPPGATYDEVIYTAEAQSIVKYGTDLAGGWKPWNLEPSDAFYTELTSTVIAPGYLLFPKNPVMAAKFIPLLLGSLIPALLGLIAYRLKRDPLVFLATATIATLNPWIFQFSRMGYDSLFSLSFYLIAIVFVLYLKPWQKLWAMLPLFLGFFQYQGHKPLAAPLMLICLLFLFAEKYDFKNILKQKKKIFKDKNIISSLVIFLFAVFLTVTYMIRLPNLTSGERISEFSFYDKTAVAEQVNEERRLGLSSSLSPIFTNKYTVLGKTLTTRFINSFNPKRFFLEGNPVVDTFTVLDYGYYHLIDIAVMVIAAIFIFSRKKDYKMLGFVLAFIIIGTIPNVIRTGKPWITFRGAFAFVGLVMFMGIGISEFLNSFNNKIKWLFITLYILLSLPFFFIYFNRYPVTHTANIGFYEKVFANYVERVGTDQNIRILPDRADATFNYLISYGQLLSEENKDQVNQAASSKEYQINKVQIESKCLRTIGDDDSGQTMFVYFFKKPCEPQHEESLTTEVKSLIDSGTIFTVYNDRLCSQYNLGKYPVTNKNNFKLDNLSDQEFCEAFFSLN